MNLNQNQIIAIVLAVLGVLVGSTAQLTDLFGPTVAKVIITVASLGQSLGAAVLVAVSGQGSIVKQVAAMDGVEKISVNAQANSTLATLAVSTTGATAKIAAVPEAVAAVKHTAEEAQ